MQPELYSQTRLSSKLVCAFHPEVVGSIPTHDTCVPKRQCFAKMWLLVLHPCIDLAGKLTAWWVRKLTYCIYSI